MSQPPVGGGVQGGAVRGGCSSLAGSRVACVRAAEACEYRERVVCSVARAARGRTSLSRYAAASPLCRTTRPLGASSGPRARPASLLLLAAWLAAVAAELACTQDSTPQVNCASCRSPQEAREHNLLVIRESLLLKLGFTQAPNTTGRQLPTVPQDVMEKYIRQQPSAGVQADAPASSRTLVAHTEQEDFLARTDKVLIFSRDDGYPLEPWLMTPIKNQQIGAPEHRYTDAHCSARNVIERCFGVLKSDFRCLSHQRQLMYEPYTAGLIVNACAVLHNMRVKHMLNIPTDIMTSTIENNDRLTDDGLEKTGTGTGRAVAERIQWRLIQTYFT